MRILLTTTDNHGNETGTRRLWLDDVLRDAESLGDMVDFDFDLIA